jgi:hypothetical protein
LQIQSCENALFCIDSHRNSKKHKKKKGGFAGDVSTAWRVRISPEFIRSVLLKNLLSFRFTIKLGNIMPSLKKKNAAKKAKHEAKTGK